MINRKRIFALCLFLTLFYTQALAVTGTVSREGTPESGVLVTCEVKNKAGTFVEWNGVIDPDPSDSETSTWDMYGADYYGQNNPMQTNGDGRYGFLLPAGEFRFVVNKGAKDEWISSSFQVGEGSDKVDNSYFVPIDLASPPPTPTPSPTPTPTPSSTPPSGGGSSGGSSGGGGSSSSSSKPAPTPTPTPVPEEKRVGTFRTDAAGIRYISGYSDGTFRSSQALTRYEMAEIFSRLVVLPEESSHSFTDVDGAHSTVVGQLVRAEIINGFSDGTFRGQSPMTRAQVSKILCLMLDLQPDSRSTEFTDLSRHWAAGYISALTHEGYIAGYPDGTFRPDNEVTRAEFVTLINRIIGREDLEGEDPTFSDVKETFWAKSDICKASFPLSTHITQ